MNNTMVYKGYVGTVEYSEPDRILCGQVLGIRSLISFEGNTITELMDDFHGAIDDYLSLCESTGKEPERPYKGSFNVRFRNPDLHRLAAIYALNHNQSLNSVVEESVTFFLMAKQPAVSDGI